MILLRSLLFQGAFYLTTLVMMVALAPVLLMPRKWGWPVVPLWARINLWLLRKIVGLKMEVRGRENIPDGGYVVASKHQSAFETFAIIPEFPDPTYILKRELRFIPLFGWYTIRMKQIPVDRGRGATALASMLEAAKEAIAEDRQILIFPEGTRRPVGAEPRYKYGVAHLYRELGCRVLPVAINAGLYWPRRGWRLYPGTVVVSFLPPIEPGLEPNAFHRLLTERIEAASDHLILEVARTDPALPTLDKVAIAWSERGKVLPRSQHAHEGHCSTNP